tara:strand:+ start:728 stop:2524 length:1797 start_codon:yes stop_codon:yes gene_type:complete
MCGIFLSSTKISKKNLNVIISRLSERGPDDIKIRNSEKGSYVFTRLAITGRDASSMQPLQEISFSKKFFLFNGEIYNYKVLSKIFKIKKKNFSDTVVLQNLIKKFDFLAAVKKINGMFAISYVTNNFKNVHLARDMFGQKPLYYRIYNNNWYVSSDPYCIALTTKIDLNKRYFKSFIYSNEEFGTKGLLCSNGTFFKDIKSVPSNYYIKLGKKKILKIKQINKENKIYPKTKSTNIKVTALKLKSIIEKTVKNYCGNHKDVAFTYSGGIDSTILLLASLKLKRKFTYYTKIAEYIDSIAKRSIRNLKLLNIKKYFRVKIKLSNYYSDLIDFISYSGSAPRWGTAPSLTPLYKLMHQHNKKICIGGDGADELFFGYPNNDKIVKEFNLNKRFSNINYTKFVKNFTNSGWVNKAENKLKFYINELKKYENNFLKTYNNDFNALLFSRYIDLKFFFSNVVTPHSDLCSMKNSIELRSPFLDKDIVNFSFNELGKDSVLNSPKFENKLILKEIIKEQCKELKIKDKIFISKEKHGTRNFAIQSAKQIKTKNLPMVIRKIFKNELNTKYSDKTKYKIISLAIFYMIFFEKKNKKQIMTSLKIS